MKRKQTTRMFLLLVFLVLGSIRAWSTGVQEEESESYRFLYAHGPWDISGGRKSLDEQPNDIYFQYVEEQIGIVPLTMSWEWEGSKGYLQGLRLALAGGEKLEAIRPWDEAFSNELIESGIAIPMEAYLENAPNIKEFYTDAQWELIKNKQGGHVYYLPQYAHMMGVRAGMIRKDWLDRVGLDVPETRDELLEVYRAFKAQDANGNGDPNDELPVSGRELFRWFDDLFVMHGVAMYEGHPEWKWNEAKGIFESSQVSDGMYEAVKFIKQLYDEGLMDPTMPAQTNADWTAKLNSGRIGHYFHLLGFVHTKSAFALGKDPNTDGLEYWAVMPYPPEVPEVPLQENYYPSMQNPALMLTKYAKHPEKIVAWFDWGCSEAGNLYGQIGIEGYNYKMSNGKIEVIEPVPSTFLYHAGFRDFIPELLRMTPMGELKIDMIQQVKDKVRDTETMLMPAAVYEGYEDFNPYVAGFYRENIGKFIVGQRPLAEWNAYVEEWYRRGGQVVTDRATAWYKEFFGK